VDLNHRPLGYEPNRTTLKRCDAVKLTCFNPYKGTF
jgi:hypothetical protein